MSHPPLALSRLNLNATCEICGKPRSCGSNTHKHVKCSKIRQKRFEAERQEESRKCPHGLRMNQSCFDCMSILHGAKS